MHLTDCEMPVIIGALSYSVVVQSAQHNFLDPVNESRSLFFWQEGLINVKLYCVFYALFYDLRICTFCMCLCEVWIKNDSLIDIDFDIGIKLAFILQSFIVCFIRNDIHRRNVDVCKFIQDHMEFSWLHSYLKHAQSTFA